MSAVSHLAMTTFCWLPPERFRACCCTLGVRMRSAATYRSALARRVGRSAPCPASPGSGGARPGPCWSPRPCPASGRSACGPRRDSRCRGAPRPPGCWMWTFLPSTPDLARVDGVGAEDGARHLGPAGAHQPGEAEDLAPLQLEADVLDRRRPRCRFLTSSTTSWLALFGISGARLVDGPAHHHADDLVDACASAVATRVDVAAVAHDGDAIGDLLQLLQAVGDVDDAHALVARAGG